MAKISKKRKAAMAKVDTPTNIIRWLKLPK
jgi:hypothetical protein